MSGMYEYRKWDMYAAQDSNSLIWPMKYHRQVEICLVLEGELSLTVADSRHVLKPGDLYVIFPNVLHAVDMTHASKQLWIFNPVLVPALSELLLSRRPKCPVLRQKAVSEPVLCLLDRCVKLFLKDKNLYRQVLLSHCASLMQELLLQLELIQLSEDQRLSQRLADYMAENFRSDITLASASKALGYNKFYISHMVSAVFGCNFRTLVNNYRISAAQEDLWDRKKDIWQIAYACGFQNQSTFNRAFIKLCGMTPTEYRRLSAKR